MMKDLYIKTKEYCYLILTGRWLKPHLEVPVWYIRHLVLAG